MMVLINAMLPVWDKVSEFLGEEPSRLVKDALAIEPDSPQPSAAGQR